MSCPGHRARTRRVYLISYSLDGMPCEGFHASKELTVNSGNATRDALLQNHIHLRQKSGGPRISNTYVAIQSIVYNMVINIVCISFPGFLHNKTSCSGFVPNCTHYTRDKHYNILRALPRCISSSSSRNNCAMK